MNPDQPNTTAKPKFTPVVKRKSSTTATTKQNQVETDTPGADLSAYIAAPAPQHTRRVQPSSRPVIAPKSVVSTKANVNDNNNNDEEDETIEKSSKTAITAPTYMVNANPLHEEPTTSGVVEAIVKEEAHSLTRTGARSTTTVSSMQRAVKSVYSKKLLDLTDPKGDASGPGHSDDDSESDEEDDENLVSDNVIDLSTDDYDFMRPVVLPSHARSSSAQQGHNQTDASVFLGTSVEAGRQSFLVQLPSDLRLRAPQVTSNDNSNDINELVDSSAGLGLGLGHPQSYSSSATAGGNLVSFGGSIFPPAYMLAGTGSGTGSGIGTSAPGGVPLPPDHAPTGLAEGSVSAVPVIPPGKLGKLQVMKSGRTYLVTVDGKRFEVSRGRDSSFAQFIASIQAPASNEPSSSSSSAAVTQHQNASNGSGSGNHNLLRPTYFSSAPPSDYGAKLNPSGTAAAGAVNDNFYMLDRVSKKLVVSPSYLIGRVPGSARTAQPASSHSVASSGAVPQYWGQSHMSGASAATASAAATVTSAMSAAARARSASIDGHVIDLTRHTPHSLSGLASSSATRVKEEIAQQSAANNAYLAQQQMQQQYHHQFSWPEQLQNQPQHEQLQQRGVAAKPVIKDEATTGRPPTASTNGTGASATAPVAPKPYKPSSESVLVFHPKKTKSVTKASTSSAPVSNANNANNATPVIPAAPITSTSAPSVPSNPPVQTNGKNGTASSIRQPSPSPNPSLSAIAPQPSVDVVEDNSAATSQNAAPRSRRERK